MSDCWFCGRSFAYDNLIAGYDTFEEQRLACFDCDRCLKAVIEKGWFAAPSPVLTREALSTFLDGHWPDIGVDQSDSTWLECSCGWDSSKPKALDWHAHLMAAAPTSTREENL